MFDLFYSKIYLHDDSLFILWLAVFGMYRSGVVRDNIDVGGCEITLAKWLESFIF